MDVMGDAYARAILHELNTEEARNANAASNRMQKMQQAIRGATQLQPSAAVSQFSKLFWNSTTQKTIAQMKKGDETKAETQHRLLSTEYGIANADFLYGQVLLTGDHEHDIVKDEELAIKLLASATQRGSKSAQDFLVKWCFDHYDANLLGFSVNIDNVQCQLATGLVRASLIKAAEQDDPTAHFLLGALNLKKGSENANRHDAVFHLKQAYGLGHQQWKLTNTQAAMLFNEAEEMWKEGDLWLFNYNNDTATALYNIAAKAGNKNAIARSNELFKPMSGIELFDDLFGVQTSRQQRSRLNIQ